MKDEERLIEMSKKIIANLTTENRNLYEFIQGEHKEHEEEIKRLERGKRNIEIELDDISKKLILTHNEVVDSNIKIKELEENLNVRDWRITSLEEEQEEEAKKWAEEKKRINDNCKVFLSENIGLKKEKKELLKDNEHLSGKLIKVCDEKKELEKAFIVHPCFEHGFKDRYFLCGLCHDIRERVSKKFGFDKKHEAYKAGLVKKIEKMKKFHGVVNKGDVINLIKGEK